jgi:hypothetical protein
MKSFIRTCVTVLGTIVLAGGARSQGRPAVALALSGPARGAWELPTSSPAGGFLDGFLLSVDGTQRLFHLQAMLAGVSSPCLSCIEGEIVGTLDDGAGVPNYDIRGWYSGIFDSAEGWYFVQLFHPGGTTPVGSIRGPFADSPNATPQLGAFAGRFRLRP